MVLAVVWPLFERLSDLRRRSFKASVQVVGATMLVVFAAVSVLIFVFKLEYASRGVLVGFFAANTITLILLRSFLAWWYLSRGKESRENFLKILVVGSGPRAHKLAHHLQSSSEWGIDVIGFLDPNPSAYNRRKSDNVLGNIDEIPNVLQSNVVDEVVIAVPRTLLGDLQAIVDACQEEGVKLRFMADLYDFESARTRLTMVDQIPLLSFEPVARNEGLLLVKRFFDLVVVLAAVPVLAVIFALVVVAIRLDSRGPAIFVQERIGLHKRRFKMYKFRSMVSDAESRLKEVEHLNEASGPNFKIAQDPRVTRVGAFLRRTSIDELPQLINVLKGDMSLVGPRPMSIRDVELFDKGIQRKRFSVRPGITCLWQIEGRSNLSFDDWLALDLKYIREWSFALDLKILFKTIPTVLSGKGAV